MIRTRFTEVVGCSVPIQQAPMGLVSSPDLAVAVADAGGVGTIAAFGMPAEALAGRLDAMDERTHGVLSANFLTEDVDEQAVVAAAERVRLIDFFWLDPRPRLVELVHRAGALAGWQVGSVEEAVAAADAGCDVVTVQGIEAGGHVRGRMPLLTLLDQVLDVVGIPVLGAGGIASGPAFAALLAAGADGARIGTRFIATDESGAHLWYKQAIVHAEAGSTVVTDAFAVCPLCATSPRARVLRAAAERVARSSDDVVGTATISGEAVPVPRGSGMPPVAAVTGDLAAMALYAGEGVGSVADIRPAADVIAELMAHLDRPDPGELPQPAGAPSRTTGEDR
jgi:nitronate monooxygenase